MRKTQLSERDVPAKVSVVLDDTVVSCEESAREGNTETGKANEIFPGT